MTFEEVMHELESLATDSILKAKNKNRLGFKRKKREMLILYQIS